MDKKDKVILALNEQKLKVTHTKTHKFTLILDLKAGMVYEKCSFLMFCKYNKRTGVNPRKLFHYKHQCKHLLRKKMLQIGDKSVFNTNVDVNNIS